MEGRGGERREERKGRVEGIRNRGRGSHSQIILHEKITIFKKLFQKIKTGSLDYVGDHKMLKAPES